MSIYVKDNNIWKQIETSELPPLTNRVQLWGWGHNNIGQIPINSLGDRLSPIQVSAHNINPEVWTRIVGGHHSVALKSDGTLWGWGHNVYGQIGDNTTGSKFLPVRIGSSSSWETISAKADSSYGIMSNGRLYSWGRNDYGQLGHSIMYNR
jgi:alpha-tubulin suppressor-like RCC1 family protein